MTVVGQGEDSRSLPGEIAVIACHFNPCRFASRRRNLERFLRGLRRFAIEPFLAEIAFDEAAFELPESERTHRFRTSDVLWHKERLLNLIVERLPAKYDKVVWLDADLLFEKSNWLESTARLLERFPIVQPFERAVFLDEQDRFVRVVDSIVRGVEDDRTKPNFARYHPGFAWAARREFFSRHGLFEYDVCGGGDATFVAGAFGWRDQRTERLQGPALTEAMHSWTRNVFGDVGGRGACTPGAVAHMWHGEPARRNYKDRRICLGEFAFDPARHLRRLDCGLYGWSESADARLRTAVRQYFIDRREDDAQPLTGELA